MIHLRKWNAQRACDGEIVGDISKLSSDIKLVECKVCLEWYNKATKSLKSREVLK